MTLEFTELVSRALDTFAEGMWPVIDGAMKSRSPQRSSWTGAYPDENLKADASAQIRVLLDHRAHVFRGLLSKDEFGWLHEVRNWRNKVAHRNHLTKADAFRALDTIARVLVRHAPEQARRVTQTRDALVPGVDVEAPKNPRPRLRGTLIDE